MPCEHDYIAQMLPYHDSKENHFVVRGMALYSCDAGRLFRFACKATLIYRRAIGPEFIAGVQWLV